VTKGAAPLRGLDGSLKRTWSERRPQKAISWRDRKPVFSQENSKAKERKRGKLVHWGQYGCSFIRGQSEKRPGSLEEEKKKILKGGESHSEISRKIRENSRKKNHRN